MKKKPTVQQPAPTNNGPWLTLKTSNQDKRFDAIIALCDTIKEMVKGSQPQITIRDATVSHCETGIRVDVSGVEEAR